MLVASYMHSHFFYGSLICSNYFQYFRVVPEELNSVKMVTRAGLKTNYSQQES